MGSFQQNPSDGEKNKKTKRYITPRRWGYSHQNPSDGEKNIKDIYIYNNVTQLGSFNLNPSDGKKSIKDTYIFKAQGSRHFNQTPSNVKGYFPQQKEQLSNQTSQQ